MTDALRKYRPHSLAAVAVLCGVLVSAAQAKPRTMGWVEWAWLEPGHIIIKTKLDTGAKTSSIHAVDIEEFERDDTRWVKFRIPLSERPDDSDHGEDLLVEREVRRITRIKDHVRKSTKRYVVDMRVCIGDRTFTTPVTLADRGRFNYPLLLGRSALKKRMLVDASRVFVSGKRCSGS